MVGHGGVREVDENTPTVARRRDADQRPDRLDVAPGLADEPADVLVRQLHLDGHGPSSTLERFDRDLIGLLGQRLGHVFHEGAVIDAGSARRRPVAAKAAASVEPTAAAPVEPATAAAAAPKVTPW